MKKIVLKAYLESQRKPRCLLDVLEPKMEKAKVDLARCGIEGAEEFIRELPARPSPNSRRSRSRNMKQERNCHTSRDRSPSSERGEANLRDRVMNISREQVRGQWLQKKHLRLLEEEGVQSDMEPTEELITKQMVESNKFKEPIKNWVAVDKPSDFCKWSNPSKDEERREKRKKAEKNSDRRPSSSSYDTKHRKPCADGRKPSAYDRKPSAYDRKPSAYDRKLSAYDRKPSAYDRKPSAYYRKPSAYYRKPSAYDRQSSSALIPSSIRSSSSAYIMPSSSSRTSYDSRGSSRYDRQLLGNTPSGYDRSGPSSHVTREEARSTMSSPSSTGGDKPQTYADYKAMKAAMELKRY